MMAGIQLQIQNFIKLANTANIKLTAIETTLLQASDTYKIQIGRDIYSIFKELWNVIHEDMERQAHHIQVLLVDELDQCKDKGDEWVEEHIKMI